MATVLRAIYIDGETKTGKGAASQAIAAALQRDGRKVYYDVAGDFFRRYVGLVRKELRLQETDSLPTGSPLKKAAESVYAQKQLFERDNLIGDLQRPAISQSVSILGELPIAQQAGIEWFARSMKNATETGAEVMVLDGRNPRSQIEAQRGTTATTIRTALELYMTCDPKEAARRILLGRGVVEPQADQINKESIMVIDRRERDKQRNEKPFVVPKKSINYIPEQMTAQQVLAESWRPISGYELPISVTVDNTNLAKPIMVAAVSELAIEALRFFAPDNIINR